MILYLVYSTVCMGLLLLIYHLFLEKEKMHHINRAFLVFSLVFTLTIPLIPVGIGDQLPDIILDWIDDQNAESTAIYELDSATQLIESDVSGEWLIPVESSESKSGFPYFYIILSLYTAITLLLFVRLFRIIHMIQMKADRNPRKLYQNCELVLLKEKVVPHTFMNTIFVNKDEYEAGNIGRDILIHERTHAVQKHTLDLLFVEILKTLFWFNPILYFYKKAILLNHEFLADQAVINSGVQVNTYQKLLLNTLLLQPSHGLSHSFNFSLTKKRLQMMTKTNAPFRSALKLATLPPLFFMMGFLFGCESTPADSIDQQMEIHIEFTDSDHIIFNGEEIQVDDLEPKLKDLSERFELHFFLENHPEMMAGPVMNVNRLVEKYRSSDENKPDNHISIHITEQSHIMVNDESQSLEELGRVLGDIMTDSNVIVNLRVDPDAEFGRILEVQHVLRETGALRINYSVLRDVNGLSADEFDLNGIDDLNRAARSYMSITPSEQNFEEMEKKFQHFMDVHEAYYQSQIELYSDSTLVPPPPPTPPSPMSRMSETEVSQTLTLPPPSPPSPNLNP